MPPPHARKGRHRVPLPAYRAVPLPKSPHPHPFSVSQDPAGEKAEDPRSGTNEVGKEKDRDKPQGRSRRKVHARKEGGPAESRGKGKERRNHERKRRVASSRARDVQGEGGTASTLRAQQPHSHNTAPERGAPEVHTKDGTTHHSTDSTATHPPAHKHRTGTTHNARGHTRAHSTWTADPGSPPRGQAAAGG